MIIRLLFHAIPLSVLLLAGTATSQTITFPPDPIAPKSSRECDELKERYEALTRPLEERRRAAYERWVQGGIKLNASYDHYITIRNEEVRIKRAVWDAKNAAAARCNARLNARRRAQNEAERRERSGNRHLVGSSAPLSAVNAARDSSPWNVGVEVSRGVASAALGSKNPAARVMLGQLTGAMSIRPPVSALPEGVRLSTGVARLGMGQAARWNRLQRLMVRGSTGLMLNIHESAVLDFQRVMRTFDAQERHAAYKATINRFDKRLAAISARAAPFVGRGIPATSVAYNTDPLTAMMAQVLATVRAEVAARGDASMAAMRRVAEERRRMARAAEVQRRQAEAAAAQARSPVPTYDPHEHEASQRERPFDLQTLNEQLQNQRQQLLRGCEKWEFSEYDEVMDLACERRHRF